MARINLLPWRESLRKKRQRDFGVSIAIALLLVAAGAAGTHFYVDGMIQHQKKRNALLEREIAAMDLQIRSIEALERTKAKLLARMDVIQQLQGSRPQVVHLFDEVVKTIPDGTFLQALIQKGAELTLSGKAQSNARVSSYMRNLESSLWLAKPNLQVITSRESQGLSEFILVVQQVTPVEESENSEAKGKGNK